MYVNVRTSRKRWQRATVNRVELYGANVESFNVLANYAYLQHLNQKLWFIPRSIPREYPNGAVAAQFRTTADLLLFKVCNCRVGALF
jgi:hypothetical protein